MRLISYSHLNIAPIQLRPVFSAKQPMVLPSLEDVYFSRNTKKRKARRAWINVRKKLTKKNMETYVAVPMFLLSAVMLPSKINQFAERVDRQNAKKIIQKKQECPNAKLEWGAAGDLAAVFVTEKPDNMFGDHEVREDGTATFKIKDGSGQETTIGTGKDPCDGKLLITYPSGKKETVNLNKPEKPKQMAVR